MAPAIAPTIAGPHIGERVRDELCLALYLAPRRRLSHEALAAEHAHAARVAVSGHACGAVDDPWDAHLSCNAMASTSMDVVWVPSVPWHAQLDTKSDTPACTSIDRRHSAERPVGIGSAACARKRRFHTPVPVLRVHGRAKKERRALVLAPLGPSNCAYTEKRIAVRAMNADEERKN